MNTYVIAKSILLFVFAGLCEIGGGYLFWLWLRNDKGLLLGILGGRSYLFMESFRLYNQRTSVESMLPMVVCSWFYPYCGGG